jgi:transposase, IS30 family
MQLIILAIIKHSDDRERILGHHYFNYLNEHTNGLLRQFFPKGTNFKIVKPEVLKQVVDLINYRPRKSLDYRTLYEVFYSSTSAPVALQI